MKLKQIAFAALALVACSASLSKSLAAPVPLPQIFAPGTISGPSNDADATFTPEGHTVVFSRDGAIMFSKKVGQMWSKPDIASFSGRWMDMQPTMSPDGRYLIFVSNRPVNASDMDHPRGNMWRVDRKGDGWGDSVHLPAVINTGPSVWGPSIAADGTVYFMQRPDPKGPWHIWRSKQVDGAYQAAAPLSFGDPTTQDVDPAVAPDQSFIVFSSKHPAIDAHEHLYIAFREGDGWRKPIDLGTDVNGDGNNDVNEARLGPDGKTLYFTTDRTINVSYPRTHLQAEKDLKRIQSWDDGTTNIWSTSLDPWLDGARSSK